eukprot:1443829-Pleurochrysis_carterae.AAC.3
MVHPSREPAPRIPTAPMDPMSTLHGTWTSANWSLDDQTARQSRTAFSQHRYRDGSLRPNRPSKPPPDTISPRPLRLPDIQKARCQHTSDEVILKSDEHSQFLSSASSAFVHPAQRLAPGEMLPMAATRFGMKHAMATRSIQGLD